MHWSSAILGFTVGLVYGGIYFLLAAGSAGGGHGTGIFLAAALPHGLGLLIFPVIGALAANLINARSKIIYVSLIVVHYVLVIYFLCDPDISDPIYIEKVWSYSPWGILLPAGFYLLGQLVIWSVLIRHLIIDKNATAHRYFDHVKRKEEL